MPLEQQVAAVAAAIQTALPTVEPTPGRRTPRPDAWEEDSCDDVGAEGLRCYLTWILFLFDRRGPFALLRVLAVCGLCGAVGLRW